MYKYIKIDTIFNRDMDGTKKLIEGDFKDKTVEFLKNNQWICTEKIDGTNIGIVWDGYNISYQGRTERSNIPSTLMNKLIELFGGNINEELFEQTFGNKNAILFGEGYGANICKGGGNYLNGVSFILFDIYLPEQNIWLNRSDIESIGKIFGIDVAPIILSGTLQEAVDYVKTKPKSTIGIADMEGLVCRPAIELLNKNGKRIITKIKVVDFI